MEITPQTPARTTAAAHTKRNGSVKDEHLHLPGRCQGLRYLSVTGRGVVPYVPVLVNTVSFPCPLGSQYQGGRTAFCLCSPEKSMGGVHVWASPTQHSKVLGN